MVFIFYIFNMQINMFTHNRQIFPLIKQYESPLMLLAFLFAFFRKNIGYKESFEIKIRLIRLSSQIRVNQHIFENYSERKRLT